MKPATLHQIKKELKHCSHDQLLNLCVRLANFKRDNKELLSYLLFDSDNEDAFVVSIKANIDGMFDELKNKSVYRTIKSLRKIIRYIDKIARYSNEKSTELDLRIYFCERLWNDHSSLHNLKVFHSIYSRQLDKIDKVFEKIHEDVRLDYAERMEEIRIDN